MLETSEKRPRDAQQIAPPETSEKRSGERTEGNTKRAKPSQNEEDVLEDLAYDEPGGSPGKEIQEQGSGEVTNDGQDVQEDEGTYSASTVAAVQHLREQINVFTSQVSNLLDAGKAAFMECHNKWEEKIVNLHQQQMEEWEEGIEFLNGVDSLNEDINKRLQSAQMVIGYIHPASADV